MIPQLSRSSAALRMLIVAVLGGLVASLLLAGVLAPARETQAAPGQRVDIAYVYVTGEGATAKAWYDGVASAGIPVQDALNKFAKEGYEVARMTDNLSSQEDSVAFTVLLQRKR